MAVQSPTQSSRYRTAPPSPTPTRVPVLANPFAPPPHPGSPSEKFKVDKTKPPAAPNKRKKGASGKNKKKSRKSKKEEQKENKYKYLLLLV